MVFGIFGKKTSKADDQTMIIAQVNARVQPIDRGDYFEDPLDEILTAAGLGSVTGGGTQLADDPDGIAYCDIEIMVNAEDAPTIKAIISALEGLGAPKGSVLKSTTGRDEIPFGKQGGMAVFLNGADLPGEVYANADVNEVIAGFDGLLDGIGSFRGHWQGERETGLYFYGSSFEAMKTATAEYIATEPLCGSARVVQIA